MGRFVRQNETKIRNIEDYSASPPPLGAYTCSVKQRKV